ncbi:hypothetical protein BDR04DRAFT_1108810 [Suillus decipiens]|nr:hypothetical protein BDR04DRAFT_1108810 [Suillus decipiens]
MFDNNTVNAIIYAASPGYEYPTPLKSAKMAVAEPISYHLPCVVPAISEFAASEPVLNQLKSPVDTIGSFLPAILPPKQ